ncbi:hypothetical protein GW17_00060441 [Ensete ventricosum]|nr:hypothetical protein GW17_00060441 [Ensete ventricosum]
MAGSSWSPSCHCGRSGDRCRFGVVEEVVLAEGSAGLAPKREESLVEGHAKVDEHPYDEGKFQLRLLRMSCTGMFLY